MEGALILNLTNKIKVLIAEDEDIIRKGIAAKIQALDNNFEIVYQAANGQEALDAAHALHPNVVITDIKMPVMDGLELIKKLSLSYPTIKIVVLSGYSDFAYTKQAIKYGVFNYLLKPLENDALAETLSDLKTAISSYKHLQNRSVVYSSNYTSEKNENRLYSLFAVCIGNLCYDVSDRLLTQYYEAQQADINWHDILDNLYSLPLNWYLSDSEEKNQKLICYCLPENSELNHIEASKKLADALRSACNSTTVTICSSARAFKEEDIWVCSQRMLNIIKQKLVMCRSSLFVLETDEAFVAPDALGIIKMRVNDSLRIVIERRDFQGVRDELNLIFKYITDNHVPQHDVQRILLYILRIFEFSGDEQGNNVQTDILRCISSLSQPEKIAPELVHTILDLLFPEPADIEDANSLAKQLVKYVEENFIKLENLEDITKEFKYNYSYLSRLFKKECNLSISKFVLSKRMELAKRLIENNEGLGIAQVAELSGYSDSHYFSRIFKLYTSQTPSEYKSSIILKG